MLNLGARSLPVPLHTRQWPRARACARRWWASPPRHRHYQRQGWAAGAHRQRLELRAEITARMARACRFPWWTTRMARTSWCTRRVRKASCRCCSTDSRCAVAPSSRACPAFSWGPATFPGRRQAPRQVSRASGQPRAPVKAVRRPSSMYSTGRQTEGQPHRG